MSNKIEKGFVLAAGLGTRMRHLTEDRPKPMLEVMGKTMLDYAIDALVKAGVEEVVVNTYYFAELVEEHLAKRQDVKIIISREEELLETGGGTKKVLPYFKGEPFYVLNSDVIWTDGEKDTLLDMAEHWNSDEMDLMLLLHNFNTVHFHDDVADYYLEGHCGKPLPSKHALKPVKKVVGTHIVAGPRIVHPRLFDGEPDGKYSFRDLFIKAEKAGRLYGIDHEGELFHVGDPEALEETNRIFNERNK